MASHHSQMHSPHYAHAESLATNAASAIVDESRQEGSPPSYWGNQEVSNTQYESHIPQQQWSQPAAQSDNIWANDSESMYSASTNNIPAASLAAASHEIRRYGKGDTMTASNNDIATSMSRLHVSSAASQYNNYYGQEYGGGASLASMASATSSSIPGVLGVSSGSTGGNTSGWAKDGKHSYSQYPMQQQQFQYSNQPLHMPSVPPGFISPMAASHAAAEDDSISFDSRPSKKTSFKRKGHRGGRRGNQNKSNTNNNNRGNRGKNNQSLLRDDNDSYSQSTYGDARTTSSSKASSEAIRLLIEQPSSIASRSSSQVSSLNATRLPLDELADPDASGKPILPSMEDVYGLDPTEEDEDEEEWGEDRSSATSKKRDWLLRMNRRMAETPVGELDPSSVPIAAIMNAWAKTKSAQGATMVETWLKRAQQEFDTGNTKIVPSTKMYTTAGKNFVKVWS
jgi:hypothetical protein